MRKRWIALLVVLPMLLAGCTNAAVKERTVGIDAFRKTEQGYVFQGIKWGTSPKEVGKLLNVNLQEVPVESTVQHPKSKKLLATPTEQPFVLSGVKGTLQCEFTQEGLSSICFKAKEGDNTFETAYHEIVQTFQTKFGKETKSLDEDGSLQGRPFRTKRIRWDDAVRSTTLQAILLTGKNIKSSMTVGVGTQGT